MSVVESARAGGVLFCFSFIFLFPSIASFFSVFDLGFFVLSAFFFLLKNFPLLLLTLIFLKYSFLPPLLKKMFSFPHFGFLCDDYDDVE